MLSALFPYVGASLGIVTLGGMRARSAFYEVTAEILPILLLVIAIEFRAFTVRAGEKREAPATDLFRFSAAGVVAYMLIAESLALTVIAKGGTPPFVGGAVGGAVATGFLAVLTYGAMGIFAEEGRGTGGAG